MTSFSWATAPESIIVEPVEGLKETGYVAGQVLTAGNVNWLFKYVGQIEDLIDNKKGIANGFAGLDGSGLVPATQLPSFVSSVNGSSGSVTLTAADVGAAASSHDHAGVYATMSHGHAVEDVSGLQTALNGLAAVGHTHTAAAITDLADAVAAMGLGGSVAQTDIFYVDGNLGVDATADGTMGKPFKTIQACLNYLGQPSNRNEALRHCMIYISGKSIDPASGTDLFSGIYTENLTVPNRFITLVGNGVKIDGSILKEYSSSRRFGASSSEFRPTLTTVGLTETRDSHSRIRTGFHIKDIRTSILKRSIGSIQGNGTNKITVTVASGQFAYPITIGDGTSFFPRIRIAVQGTTSYNATYDITAKINDTTFEATRISGTNANTGVESVGTFFESDSAGASGLSHDAAHINTYIQGLYTCDDGTVNSAAPTAGTEVLYLWGCRVYTGIEGRTILLQKAYDTTLGNYLTLSSIESVMGCSFGSGVAGVGNISVSTFTYATDAMGWMNNRFNNSLTFTVSNSGQTARMDAVTLTSFNNAGCTWVTNTPSIEYLDDAVGMGYLPADASKWGVQSSGTASAGAASTITDSSKSATWTANQFIGSVVTITGGTGAGQTRRIVSNTTTALTVAPNWTTNPASGSTYSISTVNTVAEALNYVAAKTIPYDIDGFCSGKPATSAHVLAFVATRAFTLPQNLTGSYAKSQTAATAETVLTVYKNASSIGTMTFAALGTSATFTFASAVSFAAGDVLRVVAPASQDSTLADLALNFKVDISI